MNKSTTTTTAVTTIPTTIPTTTDRIKYESISVNSFDSDDDELKQVSTLSLEDEIFEELEKVAHDEVKLKEVLKNFDMIYNEYKEPPSSSSPVLIKKTNSTIKKTLMKSKTCSIIESKCLFKKENQTIKKCHNNLVDKKLLENKKILLKSNQLQTKRPLSRSRSVWEISNSKIPIKNVTTLRRDFIAPTTTTLNNRILSKDDSFLLQNKKQQQQLNKTTTTTINSKPKQEYVIGIVNKNKIKSPETAKNFLNKKITVQKCKEVTRRINDGENIRLSKKINIKTDPVVSKTVVAAGAWYQSDCSDDSGHISNENDENSNVVTVIGRISEKLLDKFEPEKNAKTLIVSSSALKTEVFL